MLKKDYFKELSNSDYTYEENKSVYGLLKSMIITPKKVFDIYEVAWCYVFRVMNNNEEFSSKEELNSLIAKALIQNFYLEKYYLYYLNNIEYKNKFIELSKEDDKKIEPIKFKTMFEVCYYFIFLDIKRCRFNK